MHAQKDHRHFVLEGCAYSFHQVICVEACVRSDGTCPVPEKFCNRTGRLLRKRRPIQHQLRASRVSREIMTMVAQLQDVVHKMRQARLFEPMHPDQRRHHHYMILSAEVRNESQNGSEKVIEIRKHEILHNLNLQIQWQHVQAKLVTFETGIFFEPFPSLICLRQNHQNLVKGRGALLFFLEGAVFSLFKHQKKWSPVKTDLWLCIPAFWME